ncbi:hypothetical protein ACLKA6_013946 [Drosophila palustris]
MSQAVSNEFSSMNTGSTDASCSADDFDCYNGNVQDRLGMEAIASLHRQLDDDDNGNIDLSESDDAMGSSTTVNRLAVKDPPFWAERPEIWFAQIESQLCIAGITADKTKFHTVVASMESMVISQITDAVLNPPTVDMYGNLKRNIIERFCESELKKIQKLLSDIDLGDRRLTQLLNELRGLVKDRINEDFLKSLLMQRSPPHARAIFQASNDDLSGTAKLAEKILEVEGLAQKNVASVAAPAGSTSLPAHSLPEIVTRLDSLEKRIRSRSRSQSHLSTNRDQNNSPSECWHYSKFGSKATKVLIKIIRHINNLYSSPPTLSLSTDASDGAVGAVAHQLVDGKLQPLGFFSRKLNPAQTTFGTYDRELLAI